eukprot:183440_1
MGSNTGSPIMYRSSHGKIQNINKKTQIINEPYHHQTVTLFHEKKHTSPSFDYNNDQSQILLSNNYKLPQIELNNHHSKINSKKKFKNKFKNKSITFLNNL